MGRRNRRIDEAVPLRPIGSLSPVQSHPDGQWHVRIIPGASTTKTYRCPGCQQEIHPGTAHVVTWPADRTDGHEDRRHWHSPCWANRAHRRPGR